MRLSRETFVEHLRDNENVFLGKKLNLENQFYSVLYKTKFIFRMNEFKQGDRKLDGEDLLERKAQRSNNEREQEADPWQEKSTMVRSTLHEFGRGFILI